MFACWSDCRQRTSLCNACAVERADADGCPPYSICLTAISSPEVVFRPKKTLPNEPAPMSWPRCHEMGEMSASGSASASMCSAQAAEPRGESPGGKRAADGPLAARTRPPPVLPPGVSSSSTMLDGACVSAHGGALGAPPPDDLPFAAAAATAWSTTCAIAGVVHEAEEFNEPLPPRCEFFMNWVAIASRSSCRLGNGDGAPGGGITTSSTWSSVLGPTRLPLGVRLGARGKPSEPAGASVQAPTLAELGRPLALLPVPPIAARACGGRAQVASERTPLREPTLPPHERRGDALHSLRLGRSEARPARS